MGFHIANSRLNKSTGIRRADAIPDFIPSEESKGIIKLRHLINHIDISTIQAGFPVRSNAIDRVRWVGEVADHVDPGIGEHVHAFIVVGVRVDGVDADGVGVQFLQYGNVSFT